MRTALLEALRSPANPQLEKATAIEAQLQKAREAFEAGRYIDPKNNNATDYYRGALTLDASNAEARDGLVRVTEVMLARAEAALLDQKPREAAAAIKIARTITPTHPRIAFLEAQLNRETERSATQQQESARRCQQPETGEAHQAGQRPAESGSARRSGQRQR